MDSGMQAERKSALEEEQEEVPYKEPSHCCQITGVLMADFLVHLFLLQFLLLCCFA